MSLGRAAFVAAALFPALLLVWLFASGDLALGYREAIFWVYDRQKDFHTAMTGSLSAIADGTGLGATWALVVGSFLYGVFHAAGPGHGKVILSTYVMAQPQHVKKSVAMAFAAALMQGVVAVTLVYGLFYGFGLVPKETRAMVAWSERLSYALVIGLGAWLLWRGLSTYLADRRLKAATTGHEHHHHDPNHAHHHHEHHEHHDHGYDHSHHHGVCETCGHSHLPSESQLAQSGSWKSTLGVIASIGMRPCSGAVLVLVFAKFASIPLAGILAVFAISIGTAITVSMLAAFAVLLRDTALKVLSTQSRGYATLAANMLIGGAGLVLVIFGYGLLVGSFAAPVRSMGL